MREEITWREYWDLRLHFRDIKTPAYRHLFLLLYWPIELTFFTVSGRLPWTYHIVHCPLDDAIPFLEGFVIPYELWFLCGVFISLYTLRYDIPNFRRFMRYMIVTILLAGTVFLVWPNYFDGRPVNDMGWPRSIGDYYNAMPRKNVFTWMMAYIYHTDPPRNAFPSEHVVVALGMAAVALHSKKLRRPAFSVPFVALQLVICASVSFTKQHSVMDILGALPVTLVGYLTCFVPWKKLRRRNRSAAR